jgi:hypothetical protein
MSPRAFWLAFPLGAAVWICLCLLARGVYLAVTR